MGIYKIDVFYKSGDRQQMEIEVSTAAIASEVVSGMSHLDPVEKVQYTWPDGRVIAIKDGYRIASVTR